MQNQSQFLKKAEDDMPKTVDEGRKTIEKFIDIYVKENREELKGIALELGATPEEANEALEEVCQEEKQEAVKRFENKIESKTKQNTPHL